MADRFNDVGKVKINLADIDLQINWEVQPAEVTSIDLSNAAIQLINTQTIGENASVFLDVSKGYNRQRFVCGTNADLNNLLPISQTTGSNKLLKAFKPDAKFELNIVNSTNKSLFRRSPTISTSEGDLTEMFFIKEDSTLGEIPYHVEPPQRNEGPRCTISVSSLCYKQFDRAISSNTAISHILKIDAFRTSIMHIGNEYVTDDSALEDEAYSPWILWIKDVLRIDLPADNSRDIVDNWVKQIVGEFSRYFTLGSLINSGLKKVFGGE